MSAIIRLHVIPITDLPQMVKSETPRENVAKVNCILQSEYLPAHQQLEVSVNGVLQQGVPESTHQIVFSWQLMKASDEIRIKLLNRGVITKHWQGCWNERDAILYMGTLALQVFFDGKPQPVATTTGGLTAAATLASMHPSLETGNGNGHHNVLSASEHTLSAPNEPPDGQTGIIVQDLLLIAEPQHDQERPDDEANPQIVDEAREEIEREDETEDELGDEPDHGFDEGLEDEREDEPDDEPDDEMVGNERAREEPLETLEDPQTSVQSATTIGMRIAAFHANSQHSEETLEALKNLMATMPSKTVLIDLRQHSQTKKRHQGLSGLSKDHLRAVFGGTYWDRGWAIQTTYRSVPTSESPSGWRRAVIHPESHPDGILSLIRFLQEGYSMVVIDQMAAYEESPRRGVIEELHHRLPDLVVGPLG